MLNDTKKGLYIQQNPRFHNTDSLHSSRMQGNPQSTEQNGSAQIISNYSNNENKSAHSEPLISSHSNIHQLQQSIDPEKIIDLKKLDQIQEQQKQIERVAEQLIILKDIIKKLKISIGVLVEDEISHQDIRYSSNDSNYNLSQEQGNLQNALRKLQLMHDKRITPEYRQWITQYFTKIHSDIKQIKNQFQNYQKARKKSDNFELKQSKVSLNSDKFYETLIEYQVKCKLLECVLKLCKGKNIFSTADYINFSKDIEPVNNQMLIQNLNKYKMASITQKVRSIKKSSPEEMFYQWKTIHDELQIVNLQQIQRFYKQKKQQAYLNNYDNNQNGILIIGGSGVGKTTLFLSLAGEKMIKKKIKSKNCEFQNYQAADNEMAFQYKTSPFSTSCTREPAKLEAPKKYTFPQQLCLIDTAGFEDNRSGQIDIMNTLYTYQTIEQMKKLRIIIVISEKSIGERDQGLNKFAKHIARYFRDYEQVRESILFVLTKFQNIKKLKIACDNLLKISSNHKQSNEYKFIKHLQQSIVYKQCIEFKPTDQNTIFDTQYHIDSGQLDAKLKKLYKNLLKKFPIHHEYENDYINLEYSRQTKDKIVQKKCYLQNMIRKLYKQGNNNFRFYLEQLMFLENKINKIENHEKIRYANNQQNPNTFDILTFIEEINSQVLKRFSELLQQYFNDCNPEILKNIIDLRNRYSNLFLGNVDVMVENTEILQQDSEYIFQQIAESINSLKQEFEKIVTEKNKGIMKNLKLKPKWCHDIKNKKWLCAVLNFTNEYFKNQVDQQKQLVVMSNKKQVGQIIYNKEYKALIKQLKKNQQKFKQQLSDEVNIMDQEITNFLVKRTNEQNSQNEFSIQTQKQIYQTYNNYKKLIFHHQVVENNQKLGKIIIQIPEDEKIYHSNIEYIVSILKSNLDNQFNNICENIELMNMINHNLKDSDPDISRNVFLQVQRYSEKIKMYFKCDKQIYELVQSFYNKVIKKVYKIIKEINQNLFNVTKEQQQQQIINSSSYTQKKSNQTDDNKTVIKLNSNILYCYLSKINEIQEFKQLKKEMGFQVRCFNAKLRDYTINLQKYLQKYDERLSQFKKIMRKQKNIRKNFIDLEVYSKIKKYIDQCIQIEHQIKLIHHYFRNQQEENTSKIDPIKFNHLEYIQSISYRHSRFLENQKKSIKQSYKFSNKVENQSAQFDEKFIPLDLIIDYVILEEIYIQKIKYDDSHEFKKLHNAYEASKINFEQINEFEEMKIHELKMLNQCKERILQKLFKFPNQIEEFQIAKIQTEQFQIDFPPETIKKILQMFLYFIKLRQIFEDLENLNNEQVNHDFRVIELSQMSSPIQKIEEKIEKLSNSIITICDLAQYKYTQLKESLLQIILEEPIKQQIVNYLKGCQLLCILSKKLQETSLQGLQPLEQSLQNFKRKTLFEEIKQFVDKCESIFYRISKNIDSIQLGHLQNISEVLDKPQSTAEFLKILKSQCIFFIEMLEQEKSNKNLVNEILQSLKDLLKKIQQSQNQVDFHWEDEMKQLEKTSKDPKNSLEKLIKLYEHHISKVSVQKTLQYRFVELKKQELADQIKDFLNQPGQKNAQAGKALCQQLKSYLQFLKSMKFKMVVNANEIDDIKNIHEMERYYEKQASKSQAAKSQTGRSGAGKSQSNMTHNEMKQDLLSIDQISSQIDDIERESLSNVNTSQFGFSKERPIKKKSLMIKSDIWEDKKSVTSKTPKANVNMDQSFSSIVDDWTKQIATNNFSKDPTKNRVRLNSATNEDRDSHLMNSSSMNNLGRNNMDDIKKYSIQAGNGMKKSSINLKYTPPPELAYDRGEQKTNHSTQLSSKQLINSESNPNLNIYGNKYSKTMMAKNKTQKQIIL